ncbi:uncharacterized protein [Bemisia tabaci]|uniref:uncharacterized protein n=1 Tax=Bemisia tabaci TaxID=7038 RepID=UPI003B288519
MEMLANFVQKLWRSAHIATPGVSGEMEMVECDSVKRNLWASSVLEDEITSPARYVVDDLPIRPSATSEADSSVVQDSATSEGSLRCLPPKNVLWSCMDPQTQTTTPKTSASNSAPVNAATRTTAYIDTPDAPPRPAAKIAAPVNAATSTAANFATAASTLVQSPSSPRIQHLNCNSSSNLDISAG